MARRSSKAGSRRSTRRNRVAPRRPPVPAAPTAPARRPEAAAATPEPEEREADAARERRPSSPPATAAYAGVSSALGERARAEYHYVGRDLRNIAILTAIMAILLLVAWLVVPALGLVNR
jgi:hypothetical protein